MKLDIGLLFERYRVRLWGGKSEVQILRRSNRTQCCQLLATDATFLRKSGVAQAQ